MMGGRQRTKSTRASSPKFIQNLVDITTDLNQTLMLSCRVRGYPLPEVHWERDGKRLAKTRNVHTVRCGENCVLELKNIQSTDVGVYQCQAENMNGKATTQCRIHVSGVQDIKDSVPFARRSNFRSSSSFRSRSADQSSPETLVRATFTSGKDKDFVDNVPKQNKHYEVPKRPSSSQKQRVRTDVNVDRNQRPKSANKVLGRPHIPDLILTGYTRPQSCNTVNKVSAVKTQFQRSAKTNENLYFYRNLTTKKHQTPLESTPKTPARNLETSSSDSVTTNDRKSLPSVATRNNRTLSTYEKKDKIKNDSSSMTKVTSQTEPSKSDKDVVSMTLQNGHLNESEYKVTNVAVAQSLKVHEEICDTSNRFENVADLESESNKNSLNAVGMMLEESIDEGMENLVLPEITVNKVGDADEFDELLETCQCKCHTPERKPSIVNPVVHIDSISVISVEKDVQLPKIPLELQKTIETKPSEVTKEKLHPALRVAIHMIPSKITKGPNSVTVRNGENVSLTTNFIGTPPNNVMWMRGGTFIEHGGAYSLNMEAFSSELTIHSVTADHSGKYVATVENEFGGDSCFASVAVLGFPKPPGGPPTASDFTVQSLVLSWYGSVYDGGTALTGYVVEVCKVPERQWTIAAMCIDTTCIVDDLSLHQRYLFRVRAKNRFGMSEPSRETQTICLDDYVTQQTDENEDLTNHAITIQPFSEFMDRYDLKEEAGRGKFGKVYRCVDKWTGLSRAAKMIRCRKSKDRTDVNREIEVMKKLQHPKLLKIAGAFESDKMMVMVTEYISGGELFQRVVMDDFVLTESDCILFMRQICDGVSYMHRCSILHLDLKPENILCKTRTSHQIKIIDFGLSTFYNPQESLCILFGTPEFVAPEVIAFEPVGPPSDMWSVGVICYVLLSGLSPFLGDSESETFSNITRGEIDFDEEEFDNVSNNAKKFISDIIVKNPRRRLTAAECLNHAWLKRAYWLEDYPPLSTEKLKKFIIRRKWQKSGTAIRALKRFVTLSRSSAESFGELNSPITPISPAPTDTSEDSGVFNDSSGFDFSP